MWMKFLKQLINIWKSVHLKSPDLKPACTSDIVGIDHLTHTLKRAIEHFGESEYGKLGL